MDAVIDEVFGIKLLGKFELSAAEEFLECAFRDALFCSCKEEPKMTPPSKNKQVLTAVSVFIRM